MEIKDNRFIYHGEIDEVWVYDSESGGFMPMQITEIDKDEYVTLKGVYGTIISIESSLSLLKNLVFHNTRQASQL